ncbi:MAG: hypothetical protein IPN63_06460 [Gammaproteobacteria bacterium]|nr:hypothetical protein [Gammaproteobacteria bacterium]
MTRIARRVRNPEQEFHDRRTVSERASDTIAAFGGSLAVHLLFPTVLLTWTLLNHGTPGAAAALSTLTRSFS